MRKRRQYRGGFWYSGLIDVARKLRSDQTRAETVLWSHLRGSQMAGFKFRRQHQFGNYVVDFYCREAQLVIECDGPVHETNEQWHHDQTRDAYMVGQGLKVLRFSNDEVLKDTENVVRAIMVCLIGGERPR